jgi:hypothetical protein
MNLEKLKSVLEKTNPNKIDEIEFHPTKKKLVGAGIDENRAIVYNPRMIRAFIKQVEKKFPKYKGEIQQAEDDEIVFPNDPKLINFFKGAREVKFVLKDETNIEEAVKPEDFVKGGDDKIVKREVDKLIGKIFMNNKLSKEIEKAKAYQEGLKGKVKKNPYKKDTVDFHLFILGQQVAETD